MLPDLSANLRPSHLAQSGSPSDSVDLGRRWCGFADLYRRIPRLPIKPQVHHIFNNIYSIYNSTHMGPNYTHT